MSGLSCLNSAPQRSTVDVATIPPTAPRLLEDPHKQPPDAQHRNGTLRRNLSVIGVTHADHVTGSSPRARPSTSRPDTTPTLTGSLPTTSSSISTTRRARRGNCPPRLPSSETLRLGVFAVPIIPHVVAHVPYLYIPPYTKLYPVFRRRSNPPQPNVLSCSCFGLQPCAALCFVLLLFRSLLDSPRLRGLRVSHTRRTESPMLAPAFRPPPNVRKRT